MKRLAFIIAALILVISNSSYTVMSRRVDKEQEIHNLVSQLSWDSTTVTCGLILQIYPEGEAATQLIRIGKPATDMLLSALNDKKKALAAHVILTAIWEPQPINHVTSEAIYKRKLLGKKIVAFIQVFKGLKWTIYRNGEQQIDDSDLMENASKWQQKIADYRMSKTSKDTPNNSFNASGD